MLSKSRLYGPTSVSDLANVLVAECEHIPAASFQNHVESLEHLKALIAGD